MKRMWCLLAAVLVVGASVTGVALAATSPTVSTGGATSVSNTTAVLNGHVNPNGAATNYLFSYGLTTAYGANSAAGTTGSGTTSVAVGKKITGLAPGTVYHYRISASSSAGAAAGKDRTFKTAGHPLAAVVTGPAVNVGKSIATPTATINPNGVATTYEFQYGLTTAYGSQVAGSAALLPVTTPEGVSVALSGLKSATLFHYRVVAFHHGIASYGADQTFFTEPLIRPKADLTTRTSPKSDSKSPYSFGTGGTLHGNTEYPATGRCTGKVGIRYYNGRRQLAYALATIGGNCKFAQKVSFRRYYGHGPTRLKITIDFRGNGYLNKVNKTNYVTVG
ncbi:MAG: hypothetical protein WAK93_06375 [Solirubrobacteraceae bacterium]